MSETRIVHFTVDPALAAYSGYCDAEGREFSPEDYDLFAAGFRWRDSMDGVVASCGHDICLMEAALHGFGKCSEFDQIVIGIYCPLSVCASKAAAQERAAAGGGAGS